MSHTPMNAAASSVLAQMGLKWCSHCAKERNPEGGRKPPGRRPWQCAQCVAKVKARAK
jgi:hypothetical protein